MSWTLRLTAAALAAACWLAAPAGAAGLLGGGEQAPAVPGVVAEPVTHVPSAGAALKEAVPSSAEPAASVRRRVAAARPAAGAPVGGAAKNAEAAKTVAAARPALDSAVQGGTETVSGAGPAVRAAAETAAALGSGARGAGETAAALGAGARLDAARRAADIGVGATDGGGPTASGAGRAGPVHDGRSPGSSAIAAAAQLARLQAHSPDPSALPHPASLDTLHAAAQTALSAVGYHAAGAPRPGEAESATADRSSGPAPLQTTGGGSPFSSTAASFSLGGLAILLATLFLAGPAVRRRLPGRTVNAWPAAFVPLLERPG